jgi:hypothetical protein
LLVETWLTGDEERFKAALWTASPGTPAITLPH